MAVLNTQPDGTMTGGTPGMAPVPTPHDQLASAVVNLLSWAQNRSNQSNTALTGQEENLKNTALNEADPQADTPFSKILAQTGSNFSSIAPESMASVQPGVTSIEDQMKLNNAAVSNANQSAQTTLALKGVYTPTTNPNTGLPDGFNTTTGTWASDDNQPTPSGTTGIHPQTGSTLIGGVDLTGAATSTQPYASDPNYVTEVGGLYKSLATTMPQATVANLDTYIGSHATKSPVTGQMILNAANTYGVDPLVLTAVLAHESDFGTAGKAVSTLNPGNVGNTDSGATQTFQSWQAGVNATAAELAKRMPGNPNAPKPTAPTSVLGGEFSPVAAANVAKLPPYMQKFVDAGPSGVAYINSTKIAGLPAGTISAIQNQAAAAGVPYMDSADVANLKAIQTVQEQIKNMSDDIKTTLQSGVGGGLADRTWAPIAQWLQTPWGNALRKLTSYRDTAIKAVQALAGGQGSGLRINTGEIMANTQSFLPSTSDSVESAQVGINQLSNYLNQQLSTTFPYITQTQSTPAAAPETPSTVTMTGPKGTFTVSADKVSIMQQNGYTTAQ